MATFRFILIDDDQVSNKITKTLISHAFSGSAVLVFTNVEEAFEYIVREYLFMESEIPTILLLDLDMPGKNGWDFLDLYIQLSDRIQNQIKVFILSSSINPEDIKCAGQSRFIQNFISKPLTSQCLFQTVSAATSFNEKQMM